MNKRELQTYYSGLDVVFENEVLWGVKEYTVPFNYYVQYDVEIEWDKSPIRSISDLSFEIDEIVIKRALGIRNVLQKEVVEETKEREYESRLSEEDVILPQEKSQVQSMIEAQSFSQESQTPRPYIGTKELPVDVNKLFQSYYMESQIEEDNLFPDESPVGRDIKKDMEEEEHLKLMSDQQKYLLKDQRMSIAYNLEDFPLAEPDKIKKLGEEHLKFFNLLSKLQETHSPSDFKTAYNIQDRIAYLLDNQTLLYRTLTLQLIKYLEKINVKLEKYYEEVRIKQEDLKKINAQISRFNEYDRKTKSRLKEVEEENKLLKEDTAKYEEQLQSIIKPTSKESEIS